MSSASEAIACQPQLFSTLVFLDTETTGLPDGVSSPRITEICLLAVSRFALEDDATLPRVQNKLVLCFHPMSIIGAQASAISGLTHENLYHQKDFDLKAIEQIQLFLHRLDPPICIIAQNGFKFDFPIIKSEIFRIKKESYNFVDCKGNAVVCSDSLLLFKALSNKINDSGVGISITDNLAVCAGQPLAHSTPEKVQYRSPFSLSAVYERVFGHQHDAAHSAEGDCFAVMRLVQHLGIPALSWFDCNYLSFNDIKTFQFIDGNASPLPTGRFPYEVGCGPYDDAIDLTD
ncbi:unnamed protein product [Mesocestoides corti]|uniref:Exonuclease domain-containing protein n=1 Tax=Mesocestoides corti TaxID=53468 RepID=A0A0R3U442_MESCO|nr:unnamed protein product [Mesocestoides corti]